MTDLTSFISIAPSNGFFFQNASNNDMVIYTESNGQSIHIGSKSNAPSMLCVSRDEARFGGNIRLTSGYVYDIGSLSEPFRLSYAEGSICSYVLANDFACLGTNFKYGCVTVGTPSLCNFLSIDAGENEYGNFQGIVSLNFNGYTVGNASNFCKQINSNKQMWRLYVDQSSNKDCFGIDCATSGPSQCNQTFLIVNSNGYVGIGTSNPIAALDVRGGSIGFQGAADTRVLINRLSNNNISSLIFTTGSSNATTNGQGEIGFTADSNLSFKVNASLGLYSTRMVISPTGNVGVGTAAPTAKMHVNGDFFVENGNLAATGTLLAGNSNYSQYTDGTLMVYNSKDSLGQGSALAYLTASNNTHFIVGKHARTGNGEALLWVPTNHSITIGTSNVARMYITSNGNVGVGTTTPTSRLQVSDGHLTLNSPGTFPTSTGGITRVYGGFASPNAGRIVFGDQTGWKFNFSTVNGAGTSAFDLVTVMDTGNVGIGATTPLSTLHVSKTAASATGPTILLQNPAGGVGATSAIDFHNYSTTGLANGYSARLATMDDGGYSSHFAFSTKVPGSITGALTERMRIASAGNVGIGTSAPTYKLHVAGDVYATGNITAFSDSNHKKDIRPIKAAIEKISGIEGYTFEFESNPGKRCAGVLAQEVRSVLPEVVSENPSDGTLSVAYGNLSALLINAIKELASRVEFLEAELKSAR